MWVLPFPADAGSLGLNTYLLVTSTAPTTLGTKISFHGLFEVSKSRLLTFARAIAHLVCPLTCGLKPQTPTFPLLCRGLGMGAQ